ncbi:MAG: hypothetical protein R2755_13400 [Acidimicrobiales bacterium]
MGLFNRRSATPTASEAPAPPLEDIGVDRAAALHASGVVLLDVREADEARRARPQRCAPALGRAATQLQHLRKAPHVLWSAARRTVAAGGRLLRDAGVR